MSRQQTFAPDEPERNRSKADHKRPKPWVLWHAWRRWWITRKGNVEWHRRGRYRTKEEARHVMEKEIRTWAGYGDRNAGRIATKLQDVYSKDNYRIMHEDEGKPDATTNE